MDLASLSRIPRHFTASGVVIHEDHILLVNHRRIGAWLPPGGHIEEYEMPHEAAVREVWEETGVRVEVISDSEPEHDNGDAFFIYQPLCLHAVKAFERGQEIYHLDMVYLCRVMLAESVSQSAAKSPLPELTGSPEVVGSRWISLAELPSLNLARNVSQMVALALAQLARQH